MDLLSAKRKLLPLGNPQDSGGGGGGGTSTQTSVTDLPEWARGYGKDILAKGAALTDTAQNPYQTYGGQRIAGFQPLQEQAFKSAATMDAGPQGFQQNVGAYMSPYMQNVVDVEKREAGRQSGIMGTQQQAQATQAGAFGGARDALQRAERERNLAQQMGDIQTRGSQAAYESAANQFRQGITQQSGLAQLQGQMGAQQQQQAQRPLDVAYQDFLNQQNYPYKQLGFMSDLLRGTPTGSSSTVSMYQAPGSTLGQLGGLGMGLYGLSKMGAFADGGQIESEEPVVRYAEGGVTSQGNIANILAKLSDQQLAAAREAAMNRRDVGQLQLIEAELAERASMRNGLGAGITDEYANHLTEQMADGGIVAFADGGNAEDLGPGDYTLPAFNKPLIEMLRSDIVNKRAAEREAATKAAAKPAAPAPTTYTAGAGRGTYQGYNAASDIKVPAKAAAKEPQIEIPAGIKAAAAEKGFTEDDLMNSMKRMKEYLKSENAEELQGLKDLIDKQAGKSKEIKEQALGKALAEFGFAMAAGAAKPGARFLESAAGASPTLTASAAESQKLAQAADENAARLQTEYTKYKIALDKNDTNAATQYASNVRQLQMQQQQLNLKKQELAQQGAYQQGMLGEAKAARQEKGQQFNQLLGVKGLSALAQQEQARTRMADVRRKATVDFDNANRRKLAELTQQLGSRQGEYQYNQLRNQYVNDVLQQHVDTTTPQGSARVPSIFDLVPE